MEDAYNEGNLESDFDDEDFDDDFDDDFEEEPADEHESEHEEVASDDPTEVDDDMLPEGEFGDDD